MRRTSDPAAAVGVRGEFETYPGDDDGRPFTLITCGQAWHWLDPERRMTQAARLLQPGGWLALFWNRRAESTSAGDAAIDAVYAELFRAAPPRNGGLPIGPPDVSMLPADEHFEEAARRSFPWVCRYTTREWIDLLQTHSDHRMLDAQTLGQVLVRVATVIDAHGGTLAHPYDTSSWSARRR